MSHAYILAASRTPVGKFLGGLSTLSATDLGAHAIRSTLAQAGFSGDQVEETIMGMVLPAGTGQAPARQAALKAGIPETVGALTINKVCGSGLKAVMLADQIIRAGDAQTLIAGGMESMSQAPHLLSGSRSGYKFGNQQMLDHLLHDGLWCSTEDVVMGELAEYIAEKCNIDRTAQDDFSARSHLNATQAIKAGHFQNEISPVTIKHRKGDTTVEHDEGPRAESTADALGKLRPAFQKEGSVTAGNASQLSDGAAAVLVVNQAVADAANTPLKARIIASATSGVAPKDLFIAPITAMEKVLDKAKLSVNEIDLFELNEAFASQCLACLQPFDIPAEKINVHGGAIAIGHPLGASGARVLVTLLHALKQRKQRYGLASLCLGGGNAVAMIVENLS